MSKILLIHGFGIGIKSSVFKNPEGEDAGFLAFKELVEKHDAAVFRWDIPGDFDLQKVLQFKNYLEHYELERERASSEKIHEDLHIMLEKERPTLIVCHSMGAWLLLSYLQKYSIPDCVKVVVFVQADIPEDAQISDKKTLERLEDKSLQLINYYCPWDPALAVGGYHNKYRPAGMFKMKNPKVVNKLYPLLNNLNLHNSSIESKKWLREVESLTEDR